MRCRITEGVYTLPKQYQRHAPGGFGQPRKYWDIEFYEEQKVKPMRAVKGFTEMQRAGQEHGIEVYLLHRPATCTLGHWDKENWRFVYCDKPAIINAAYLLLQGTGKWIMNDLCEHHANKMLKPR